MTGTGNQQATIAKMADALQGVVNDTRGMTEETYRKVIGALHLAGVNPFPPPSYRAVYRPRDDGLNWWCINDKDKTFLCAEDGDFARFETEELANDAIAESARLWNEMEGETSTPGQVVKDEVVVAMPRDLLRSLAGEQPPLSDEFGTCVFCGSGDHKKYTSPNANFNQHQACCEWVKARKIVCESAGATFDADGRLSPEEFRNYLRHRGFSLVSKTVRDRNQVLLFAYSSNETVDERPYVETATGLEAYFVCVDDQSMLLTFAQDWCDRRLTGRSNLARMPEVS